MNGESFPYNKENFDDEDNKKIAEMLEWTYCQLSKEIMTNDEKLNSHESRISELEDEILTNQTRNSYYRTIRNYMVEIGGVMIAIGLLLVAIIKLLL